MKFSNKQKALILTLILNGILLALLFIIQFKQYDTLAEILVDISTNPKEEITKPKPESSSEKQQAKTNRAYNETESYTHSQSAFDPIEPFKEDNQAQLNTSTTTEATDNQLKESGSKTPENTQYIFGAELQRFKEAETVLKQASRGNNSTNRIGSSNLKNTNSTVSYALKDRTHLFLPKPIYLCEVGGKITINITVDSYGSVINASYNGDLSESTNGCLIDHALEYAQQAIFNAEPNKPPQDGTITFDFVSKD